MVEIQKKIVEIVKTSSENPEAAVAKLMELKQEGTSPEVYDVAAYVYEAAGDIWMKAKKLGEAEKAYLEMMKMSVKLYESDKEKYDYRLGVAYYKRAVFYRMMLGCVRLDPKPKTLTEHQKKVFELTEGLYKNVIGCTLKKNVPMPLRYAQLHANVMSELLMLYSFVGDYEKAITCGKDGIRLDKAIYEKKDDKAQSFCLANRMNALATVYMFTKNVQLTMETIEDAIFVLEEHEEEDTVTFGVLLARNYLTLGGCYSQMQEEASMAEETYQKGLERMAEVNRQTNNKFIKDLIIAYKFLGNYYKATKREDTAKEYYDWAEKYETEKL